MSLFATQPSVDRRTFTTLAIRANSVLEIEQEALRQARECYGSAYYYEVVRDYNVMPGIKGSDAAKYVAKPVTVKVIPLVEIILIVSLLKVIIS